MLSRTLASNRWKCFGIDNMVLPLPCSPAKLLMLAIQLAPTEGVTMQTTNTRPLYAIASEIDSLIMHGHLHPTWYRYAKPYVDAMKELDSIDDNYYYDDGKSVVLYALSNLTSWRGDDARRIKAELKALAGIN